MAQKEGTIENPVDGRYSLRKELCKRFGLYIPSPMEVLGLAKVEPNPQNNRMRAT